MAKIRVVARNKKDWKMGVVVGVWLILLNLVKVIVTYSKNGPGLSIAWLWLAKTPCKATYPMALTY